MSLVASLAALALGSALRPPSHDPTWPLATRLGGRPVLLLAVTGDAVTFLAWRRGRPAGPVRSTIRDEHLDPPAMAALIERTFGRRSRCGLAVSLPDSPAWRHRHPIAAPAGSFARTLARRRGEWLPDAPADALVAGLLHPERPECLLASWPASVAGPWRALGGRLVRLQPALLAALRLGLSAPEIARGGHVVVRERSGPTVLEVGPDGSWGTPRALDDGDALALPGPVVAVTLDPDDLDPVPRDGPRELLPADRSLPPRLRLLSLD